MHLSALSTYVANAVCYFPGSSAGAWHGCVVFGYQVDSYLPVLNE